MKNIIFLLSFCFLSGTLFSQDQNEKEYGDRYNFAIGLPKATQVELQLIKNDLDQFSQITYSEFVFKDHVLLIECDTKGSQLLQYSSVENILHKYFEPGHILRKHITSFEELKTDYVKSDKFKIK